MSVVLVFDDLAEERDSLVNGLNEELGGGAEIVSFAAANAPAEGESYDGYIASWINRFLAGKEIGLVVCDKELGRYPNLKGLSATPVSAVALQKGVPFCQYSRQASLDSRELEKFKRLRQWSSAEISLEGLGPAEWIPQVISLFNGFECIRTAYAELGSKPGTPSAALAAILGKPASESRIALYGSGEQGYLKEIFTFYDPNNPDISVLLKRMPRILGNWLFLSILRFPGILVNKIAAASYLNIQPSAFDRNEIQNHFQSAKYTGPFSDSELGPWWWRAELDSLIGEEGCKDGREYVVKKGGAVEACLDPQSGEQAGYYCMLTQQPVSASNSRGGISWFPSGADLARIRKDKFEQITALVGMY